jgi:hypothetical protein
MNPLNELQSVAILISLFSFQSGLTIIMDVLNATEPYPLCSTEWDGPETSFLVNHLFDRRHGISQGHYGNETFTSLEEIWLENFPGRERSREAIQKEFHTVRAFQLLTDRAHRHITASTNRQTH